MTPSRGPAGGGIHAEMDPAQLRQLLKDVRDFSGELSKQMRKSFRDAAKPAIKDVQNEILSMPSGSNTGVRSGIAKGVKLSIKASKKETGVTIVASGSKLPAAKQALVNAFNKPSFRRQVYGKAWVTQSGRPYFGSVLERKKQDMENATEEALMAAIRTVRAGAAQS